MSRVCEICDKRPSSGNAVARRGKAKYLGGVGRRVLSRTKRVFKPNIQKYRVIVNGTVRRMRVCMRCLKADKITKAP